MIDIEFLSQIFIYFRLTLINKSDSRFAVGRARTLLCPITIINFVKGNQKKNCSDIRQKVRGI